MRLYIFNFDITPLTKAVATGVLLVLAVWAITPNTLPFDETPVGTVETVNELVLEQYISEHTRKPVVLVGSSIQTMVPPFDCRPEDVASIYLQGRGGQSGLEAIVRLGARPKVVLVETATLTIIPDQTLMDVVFRPIYWRIRSFIPPLRYNRNWIVLLARKLNYESHLLRRAHLPPLTWELPPQSIEEWDKNVLGPRITPYLRETNSDGSIRQAVERLVPLVRTLQQRGTRVIMYNPIDPRIAKISPMKDLKAAIRAALPDVEYVDPPDDKLPLYRVEGLHLVAGSGVLLFDYLMERAGLPVRSPCHVRSKTDTAASNNVGESRTTKLWHSGPL